MGGVTWNEELSEKGTDVHDATTRFGKALVKAQEFSDRGSMGLWTLGCGVSPTNYRRRRDRKFKFVTSEIFCRCLILICPCIKFLVKLRLKAWTSNTPGRPVPPSLKLVTALSTLRRNHPSHENEYITPSNETRIGHSDRFHYMHSPDTHPTMSVT